jgi:hypothetical protein
MAIPSHFLRLAVVLAAAYGIDEVLQENLHVPEALLSE